MGGTLFLDEIEKLPVAIGDKVADTLKNGLPSLDGRQPRKQLNVRVIAACDSNLKRLADKGLFSRKLYEMVIDTVMRIPPLRERVKDIEVIANHILAEMSAQHSMAPKKLSEQALECSLVADGPVTLNSCRVSLNKPSSILRAALSRKKTLNCRAIRPWRNPGSTDKDAFVAAWKAAGGNISKLAGMLDVSRVTLYRYLKKYNLGP
jgi:DNA-binding NtrC family response regulator